MSLTRMSRGPGSMRADQITASVRKQITNRPTRQFFVFAHYLEPHDPYDKWPGYDFGDATVDRYDSEIAYTDHNFGQILDFLEQEGLRSNTIVVAFSDHGEGLKEHEFATHNTSLYENEVRVPLVIHIPGLPGGRIKEAASLVDVMPTMTRILGIKDTVRRMGVSLLPYMLQPDKHPERWILTEQYTPRATMADLEQRALCLQEQEVHRDSGFGHLQAL